MEIADPGLTFLYNILFFAAMLLIAIISVFVILGIRKANEENKQIKETQNKQLEVMTQCAELLKEIRDGLKKE